MNSVVFLEWFENQLMPALNNPSSLAVLDNASYHNVKTEDTCVQILVRKKLFSKTILHNTTFLFSSTDTKKVLYENIKT
jgi:transposase